MQLCGNGYHALLRERGQGLLVLLALLFIVSAGLIFSLARPTSLNIATDKQTTTALAQAKDALIGYAASDANRPGELPCPDVNNDGKLTLGVDFNGGAGSPCVSLIGRLPWYTLGLPDLRDGSGERLWYALSDNFHAGATFPLNSDTMGQLTVTGGSPATNVVAIVFSPGELIDPQVRDPANENNVANYLEGENANGDTIFTTGAASATFNDRLLVITTADLIPVVEQRVARDLRKILQSYKTAVGVYPWANISDGNFNNGLNRGRIPWQIAGPQDWGSGGAPTLPAWYINNKWSQVIYYSAGENFLAGGCSSCVDPTLSVDGVAGKEVVILTPGPAGAGRPVAYPWTNWTPYLEDAENNDNSNDLYVTPTSTAYARDRIYTIP